MTDKQIIIDGVDVSGCEFYCEQHCKRVLDEDGCYVFLCAEDISCYYKQYTRKTQKYNELREYHNKCCEEFENKKKELLEKYNQLSRDFYSGKYCNLDKCKQLQIKTQECKELKNKNNILKEHSRYYKNEGKMYKKEIGRLKTKKKQAEQKLERIKDIANNYDNCNDVGHFVQDTEARHALEEVSQAMYDILQIIDEVE